MNIIYPKVYELNKYHDNRGYFFECFSKNIGEDLGVVFKQDNSSFSRKGTVRGMHYQWDEPMGKLIQVIKGNIIDYFFDLRIGSPDFGIVQKVHLSEFNNKCLWIPPYYAHGFEALEDSHIVYKCTSYYNSKGEGTISLIDEDLGISFDTIKENMIVSERDINAISLKEYIKEPKFFIE